MILETQGQLRNQKHEPGVQFRCGQCGAVKDVQTSGGTGYGYAKHTDDDNEKPICYACCGENDKKAMVERGRYTLYYNQSTAEIVNWPGSLRFRCTRSMGSRFTTVWFTGPDGKTWTGRIARMADNELINVKRKT